MLTKEDVKQIGTEVGRVIEQNVTPALNEIIERQTIMKHKLDRALYR